MTLDKARKMLMNVLYNFETKIPVFTGNSYEELHDCLLTIIKGTIKLETTCYSLANIIHSLEARGIELTKKEDKEWEKTTLQIEETTNGR